MTLVDFYTVVYVFDLFFVVMGTYCDRLRTVLSLLTNNYI